LDNRIGFGFFKNEEVVCGYLTFHFTIEAEDTLSCHHFPLSHRKRIRITNCFERFNEEIRRTQVIGYSPMRSG